MESEDLLRYYLDEVKDTQHDINNLEVEEHIPNEAEQATDFLLKAGLSNLNQLYHQGKEISDNIVIDSVRQKHLTEKQAQTVRSRVATLNKTLRSRQPRRKYRQDVRDVAWNIETSSTGTRSRSATPDSLDSGDNPNSHNEDLTSDEDHQLSSLPPFPLEHTHHVNAKTKIKSTSSEPLQSKKFTRHDNKGDIAHLGSENVVLKGYQPLVENVFPPIRPLRDRSGSDPTTESNLQPLKVQNTEPFAEPTPNFHTQLTRTSNNNTNHHCSTVYIHCNEPNNDNESLSFEGLIRQSELNHCDSRSWELEDGVSIDELSDSEYQYLKPLLYVEVVAIFDQHKISYFKKKASTKNKGGNVFGVNLSTLVMRDMPTPTDNSMVPQVFQSIINQLNTRCIAEDGILRVAGQKQKLETLCTEIEMKFYHNRRHVEELLKHATAHELTGVLKKLLRELPDPVFTMELFDMFYKAGSIADSQDKRRALNLLVLMLPIEHRNTFRVILEFLLNVIENQSKNRMGLHNVATITAPSFFPPKLLLAKTRKLLDNKMTPEERSKQLNVAANCVCIMETVLKTGQTLWTVPKNLAAQARQAQQKAQMKKDLGKEKDKKIRSKTKLVRSSTQYEPGAMNLPRIKKDFLV
ncbi:rho GTPase-activating protein conundrum [Anthonomus grandis grandis]|uniref:rho GTPase-activating protein conundrum n=1 Tax=Anthonomus grandis grandis TaxID=2921223 RepID=UPI00216540BE|nr:rho GTPase-activating protein conundrum [Anthonomus grandis grandis]XP_050314257.1 rho GTPase-activating protein conundrum [Anthonomus grandis grandis]